eukprot:scaffold303286_cov32-Tisochrysis_lutea.AAC.1
MAEIYKPSNGHGPRPHHHPNMRLCAACACRLAGPVAHEDPAGSNQRSRQQRVRRSVFYLQCGQRVPEMFDIEQRHIGGS